MTLNVISLITSHFMKMTEFDGIIFHLETHEGVSTFNY